MKQVLKVALGVVLGFVLLVVGCTALILETDNNTDSPDNPTTQEEKVKEEPVKEDKEEPKEEAQEPVAQEEEAVEAAQSYLDAMSFSRDELKQQLTSEYGSGFTEEEAEYALDQVYK